MNKLLMDNRPKDLTKEKWAETWDNQGWLLEPLYKTLKAMAKTNEPVVTDDDLTNPNHYGLMVSKAAKLQILKQIMDLLPEKAKAI